MSAQFEHLPGCDRRHTPRQRCSTWVLPEPSVAIEISERPQDPDIHGVETALPATIEFLRRTFRGPLSMVSRHPSWFAVAAILLNVLWTLVFLFWEIRIDRTCEGDGCWVVGLGVFVLWSVGEAILAPLTVWGIVFVLLRWILRFSQPVSMKIAAVAGALLGVVSLCYVILLMGG